MISGSKCLVSFGANLGDPRATIEQALQQLRAGTKATSFKASRLYHTPPVGGPTGQPPFLNCVAALETQLSPWEVWRVVREIESDLGRERIKRWEARRIDVDILLFDELRIWTPQLKIPHPRLCMRRFILEPAAEVAADWRDPVSQQTIQSLAQRLRQSRANLVLCAYQNDKPLRLLEHVAGQSAARWIEPDMIDDSYKLPTDRHTRWVAPIVSSIPCDQMQSLVTSTPPTLLVFYASDQAIESGAQWEDSHRVLAQRLGLHATSAHTAIYNQGARYLLASNDQEWVTHELIAALDAMDCPIEPIND